jgi:thiamine-monophosphate kinase
VAYQTGKTKAEQKTEATQLLQKRLGERDIIKRFIAPLTNFQSIDLNCEEDAAVLEVPAGKLLVMTTDAIVEGTHFFSTETPENIAKKALRVNLSDLAAMGAHPIGYTLCLTIGDNVTENWLSRFFVSLGEDNQTYRISLLGGDTNKSSGPINISITAIGDVAEGLAITRSGAQSGDRIYVTGTIGDAALGLKILQGQANAINEADKNFLINRYRLPQPRHSLGQHLGDVVHAATDISDGLLFDLNLICEASDLQAYVRMDKIPLSKAVANLLNAAKPEDREGILESIRAGGDDYELVFTASPGEADHIEYLAQRYSVPMTCIGHLGLKSDETPECRVVLMDENGTEIPITQLGYEHQW